MKPTYQDFKKIKIILITVSFIIIEILAFLKIKDFHNREINQHLEKVTAELVIKEKTAQHAYTLLTKNIFSQTIEKPEVLQLFSKAYNADSLQRKIIRDSLYEILSPAYEYLKMNDIKQMQFHLPDNESFLRFHRPDKYGDNLSDIRYSVKMANSTNQIYIGFEEGKMRYGFRYVFPLSYQNEHIGSVETSFSFKSLKRQMEEHGNDIFGFMINKNIVDAKVFDDIKNEYIPSLISDKYVQEKNIINYDNDSLNRLKQIDENIKSKITDRLNNNENFTVYTKINKNYYLASFVSVKNVEGNPAAYIFSYKKDNTIAKYINNNMIVHILSSIVIILIVFFILLILLNSENLKESEKKYRVLFEKSNDAILLIDKNKFIDCNFSTVKMLGYNNKSELLNTHPSKLSPEKQPDGKLSFEKAEEMMTIAYEKGTHKFEWIHTRANGEDFPVEVWLTAIPYHNKHIIHTVWRDLTERKKAEQALKKSEAELRESNNTKDKFFSIISHDLKSPFNVILGFSNILLKKHKEYDNEKREKLITSINNSANNVFKLVENLLTWSRSQSGVINYSPEKLNLKILLFETMFDLQEVANKKSIQVLDNISENDTIYSDKTMITTVLRNLISNAIKFTNNGGSIIISSKKQTNSDFLEISVEDTGVGIPKNIIDDLFRIDKNTSTQGTENEAGTGLGLILCKEFVEKHNGKIWIESEEEKGSEFIFTMPNIYN